jgi:hypothetical protein
MKKEHTLVIIIGLFLLSYVLDAVVNPLSIRLATPYQFLNPKLITMYPFTTASIVIKGLGIFLTPILFMSFAEGHYTAKGAVLLVLIGLMQLYALQDIATKAEVVPLEWALSLSLAGIALALPMIWYFIRGAVHSLHQNLGGVPEEEEIPLSDSEEE